MRYYFLVLITLLTVAISCDSDEISSYNVGSDFLENEININLLDTFAIKSSTYKLDEVTTSSTGRILLGHIDDEYLGTISSSSYFQLSSSILNSESGFDIDNDATYDSIGFVLNYDNYHYGDTMVSQTYKIYKLTESVRTDNDAFYNNDILEYDDTEYLGEVNFTPKPNRASDSLYIPLDNIFGKEIFDKIQDNDISSEVEFLAQLRGLVIIPEKTDNSHILGFNAVTTEYIAGNSSLRIFYTDENDSDDEDDETLTYLDFVVLDQSKQFNHIESSLEDNVSLLSDSQSTSIYSSDTDNKTFIQGGSGICSKIEIPSLNKLKSISEYGSIINAELVFNPAPGSYSDDYPLPDELLVFIVNKNNVIQGQLLDLDGVTPIYASLSNTSEFPEDTFYTLNLTAFVDSFVKADSDLDYGLMFQMIDYNQKVDRIIFDDDFANSSQLKLTVKYLNY